MVLKRLVMPGLVLGAILGLSVMAQAQDTCVATVPTPAARATSSGITEPTGNILVTCSHSSNGGATAQTAMVFSYGVTITSTALTGGTGFPTGAAITVAGSGDFAGIGGAVVSGGNAFNTITVNLPALANNPGGATTGSFTLSNVLASFDGTNKTNLTVSVSVASGNNYFLGGGTAIDVVSASGVQAGLVAATVLGPSGTATISSNGTVPDSNFNMKVTETYMDMFRVQNQFNGGFTGTAGNGTQLKFTFANIPAGVVISGCTAPVTIASTGAASPTATTSLSQSQVDSTNPVILATFGGSFDLATQESVLFGCNAINTTAATLPISGNSVTVVATLSPTGTATVASGNAQIIPITGTASAIPRYGANGSSTTALAVISLSNFVVQTNILLPYVSSGTGFDTAIAITNTTLDPFASGGALSQNGTITFTFFPQTGASFSYTTQTGSPGGGLVGGLLNAGSTYNVNLSFLLNAAGKPVTTTPFTGYIFVVTNFSNGHGVANLYSTTSFNFTSAVPVLVLPTTGGAPTRTVGTESLGF